MWKHSSYGFTKVRRAFTKMIEENDGVLQNFLINGLKIELIREWSYSDQLRLIEDQVQNLKPKTYEEC